MELDETAPVRGANPPAKVVTALVLMWINAAGAALGSALIRAGMDDAPASGDLLRAQVFLLPVVAFAYAAAATGLHKRKNWARIIGLVLAVIASATALLRLPDIPPGSVLAVIWSAAVFAMLISADARAWCGLAPRVRRAGT
ncbi:hypothetical protein AB0K52_13710 [Glycomyces sp. NPDC049804]|uniref:hypothetical protein n=1 Tax=Glycomyces sp. NPDC049804 TaxID=3154363 RepID=UPI0034200EF4